MKDVQHNGKKKTDKRTDNDLQNITQKTKDEANISWITSLNLVLLWQLFYLFCSCIVINTVIVTAEPLSRNESGRFWRFKIWFNPPFLYKCLYQVRVITVFTVFRLLTDFVCLYNYEFWLSLCKIVRSSVILLLPLFGLFKVTSIIITVPVMTCLIVYLWLFQKWSAPNVVWYTWNGTS